MSECCENPSDLYQFPTELLLHIFKFLSVKTLISCRLVCRRWKDIVENITRDDSLWLKHCRDDFQTLFEDAKKKSTSCVYWFDVYRSLSLWARLSDAEEFRDEFCHSSKYEDQIEDSFILYNGIAAVHKRSSISYYDMSTLQATERPPICGQFVKFVEFEDVLVALGNVLHLYIIWHNSYDNRNICSRPNVDGLKFSSIKHFRTFGRHLYFVNVHNEIYYCNLDEKMTVTRLPKNYVETVTTLSMYQGSLHMLTGERNVYRFINGEFVLVFNLEVKKDKLLHCLWQYGFIEHMFWRYYYFWLAHFRQSQPQGPLCNIMLIKVYGDVFFVGCKDGVLLIYYKPFTRGMLDLMGHEPVKRYNFTERQDIPVLSLPPIISIDVLEMRNGHKVLVGMPKKVKILTFEHSFEVIKSKAVIPYVPPGPLVVKEENILVN